MKNLKQKLISFAIVITMSMGVATLPAFATTYPDTQSPTSLSWYVEWQNTSHSIFRGESIGEILANIARWNDMGMNAIYQRMGGLSGDIQDVVTAIESIPGASDYSTILNSIDSKIKDYTNNFASVESKLQSIINNLVNVNTGLTNIKGDTNTIKTNTGSIVSNTSSTNTKLDTVISKLGILDDNYSPSSLIYVLTRRNGNSNMFPNAAPVSNPFNPLNVTYISSDSNNQFRVQAAGTGAKRSIYTMLGYTNTNIVSLFSAMQTLGTTYRVQKIDYTDGYPDFNDNGEGTEWNYVYSLADQLHYMNVNMASFFSRMGFAFADDDMIAAKNANKPQEQSVISNFTGSGDASASVSDFVGVKDSVSALKTSLSGGASYTQAFNILGGDSDGWSWFTTEVAESMDTTGNGSTRRGSVPISTPYLDSYYDSIYSVIGINGGIE